MDIMKLKLKQVNFDTNANRDERLVNVNPNKFAHSQLASTLAGIGIFAGGALGKKIPHVGWLDGATLGGVAAGYAGWDKWGRKELDSSKFYIVDVTDPQKIDKHSILGVYSDKEQARELANEMSERNKNKIIKVLKGSTLITSYPGAFH